MGRMSSQLCSRSRFCFGEADHDVVYFVGDLPLVISREGETAY